MLSSVLGWRCIARMSSMASQSDMVRSWSLTSGGKRLPIRLSSSPTVSIVRSTRCIISFCLMPTCSVYVVSRNRRRNILLKRSKWLLSWKIGRHLLRHMISRPSSACRQRLTSCWRITLLTRFLSRNTPITAVRYGMVLIILVQSRYSRRRSKRSRMLVSRHSSIPVTDITMPIASWNWRWTIGAHSGSGSTKTQIICLPVRSIGQILRHFLMWITKSLTTGLVRLSNEPIWCRKI